MHVTTVLHPIVLEDARAHAPTVAHFCDALGLAVQTEFSTLGLTVTVLGPVVVVSSPDEEALTIPRQVQALFIVDDLVSAWNRLQTRTETLVEPHEVPSGGRFVVRHPGGPTIEYLDLRNFE